MERGSASELTIRRSSCSHRDTTAASRAKAPVPRLRGDRAPSASCVPRSNRDGGMAPREASSLPGVAASRRIACRQDCGPTGISSRTTLVDRTLDATPHLHPKKPAPPSRSPRDPSFSMRTRDEKAMKDHETRVTSPRPRRRRRCQGPPSTRDRIPSASSCRGRHLTCVGVVSTRQLAHRGPGRGTVGKVSHARTNPKDPRNVRWLRGRRRPDARAPGCHGAARPRADGVGEAQGLPPRDGVWRRQPVVRVEL